MSKPWQLVTGTDSSHGAKWSWLVEATPLLSGAILAFEDVHVKVEQIAELHPRLSKWIDVGLSWVTHHYTCMDWTRAYIMVMGEWCDLWLFYFPNSYKFWIQHLHDLDPSQMVTWVHPGCQTEIKATVSCANFICGTIFLIGDISWWSTMSSPRPKGAMWHWVPSSTVSEPVRPNQVPAYTYLA